MRSLISSTSSRRNQLQAHRRTFYCTALRINTSTMTRYAAKNDYHLPMPYNPKDGASYLRASLSPQNASISPLTRPRQSFILHCGADHHSCGIRMHRESLSSVGHTLNDPSLAPLPPPPLPLLLPPPQLDQAKGGETFISLMCRPIILPKPPPPPRAPTQTPPTTALVVIVDHVSSPHSSNFNFTEQAPKRRDVSPAESPTRPSVSVPTFLFFLALLYSSLFPRHVRLITNS